MMIYIINTLGIKIRQIIDYNFISTFLLKFFEPVYNKNYRMLKNNCHLGMLQILQS